MDVLIGNLFRIQPAVDFDGGREISQGLIGFGQVNQGDFVSFIQGRNLLQQLDGIGGSAGFEATDAGVKQNVLVGRGALQRPLEVFQRLGQETELFLDERKTEKRIHVIGVLLQGLLVFPKVIFQVLVFQNEHRLDPLQSAHDRVFSPLPVDGLQQAVQVADPLVRSRVCQEVGGDGVGVKFIPPHDPKKVEHGLAIVPGLDQGCHAEPVRLLFMFPAVLQGQVGGGGHGKSGNRGGSLSASAEKRAGQNGGQRSDGHFLRFVQDGGDVPRVRVCDFMGQDAGQFGFIFHEADQPGVDVYVPARRREGVDSGAFHNEKPEIEGGFAAVRKNQISDAREIVRRFPILVQIPVLCQLVMEFPSHLVFVLDGESAGRVRRKEEAEKQDQHPERKTGRDPFQSGHARDRFRGQIHEAGPSCKGVKHGGRKIGLCFSRSIVLCAESI